MKSFSFPRWLKVTLVILLILLTVIVRLGNDHQTDFDSYWLHGMGESIELHGSALWVFHPASLFGFYPMSYPSGTPFFLATFAELTGLDMNTTVFVTSVILGLIVVGLVFMLALEIFSSEVVAYLAALIASMSPTFINYTAFNAGGRVFVMPFVLLFTWSLIQWHKKKSFAYAVIAFLGFLFAFLAHRTGMFLIPMIVAFILAKFYLHLPAIWKYIHSHHHYRKHLHPRYEKSKYYLLLDLGMIAFLLAGLKALDLIIRGRFSDNFQRLVVDRVDTFVQSSHFFLFFLAGIGLILFIGLVLLFVRLVFKKRPVKASLQFLHHHYHQIFVHPQRYFLHLLFLVTLVLFFGQFFGNSFYAPSLNEYKYGVLTGGNPLFIFTNLMVNYTTAVSIVFIFALIGFFFLLYKNKKQFADWLLVFYFIMFLGMLLDKRYTRIFLIPFIGLFAAYGIVRIYGFLSSLKQKKWLYNLKNIFIILIFLLIVVGSQFPLIRTEYEDAASSFADVGSFWETGQYIRSLGDDFSTLTTDENIAGVVIFASSGIPGGSHNIYYFVNQQYLKPVALTYETLKNKIRNGDKIEQLWYLKDWVFGGQYYLGRHAKYTFDHPFTDKITKRIINDYHERYYIHDKSLDENRFLESLIPVKNLVYDTPNTVVYDIEVGR